MTQISRADLHALLDNLLDSADPGNGALDAALFWMFVADLAQGRGIANEIGVTAAADVLEEHGLPEGLAGGSGGADVHVWWRAFNGAVLFHLLRRVELPDDRQTILPPGFNSAVAAAHFRNMVTGKSILPDAFQFGSKQGPRSMAASARLLIVESVKYLEAKEEISEAEARRRLLPSAGHPSDEDRSGTGFYRTWRDWKKAASMAGWIDRAQAAARGEISAQPYDVDAHQVAEWWSYATTHR